MRRADSCLAAGEVARLRLALELLDDLGGRARADVGHDQRLLEALPRLVVEVSNSVACSSLRERLARLAHVLAQAPEEAAALLLLLGRVGFGGRDAAVAEDEEVLPVTCHRDRRRYQRVLALHRDPPHARRRA